MVIERIKFVFSMLIFSTLISACGSSNSNTTAQNARAILLASEVPAYIAAYEEDLQRRTFLFNGQGLDAAFFQVDTENQQLVMSFNQGLIFLSIDLASRDLTGDIRVHLGNIESDVDEVINQPLARLESDSINFQKRGNDFVFSGRLEDSVTNASYSIYFVYNSSYITEGDANIEIITDSVAVIAGGLGISTYIKVKDLVTNNPGVRTLVLQDIPGSSDDRINVHTGRLIRQAGIATYVPSFGEIASGGVDIFLAGATRHYEQGGMVGVHSWCCINGKSAHLAPRNAPEHESLISYTKEMLGEEAGEAFYFFTLEASSFEDIHFMTNDQLLEHIVDNILPPNQPIN
ncbi:hypothetical protein [Pelagibaculum spongiae]|nr:hypothetical protein [Pelagibaculum spongiae]